MRAQADEPREHEVVEGRVEVVVAAVGERVGARLLADAAGPRPRRDAVKLAARDPIAFRIGSGSYAAGACGAIQIQDSTMSYMY